MPGLRHRRTNPSRCCPPPAAPARAGNADRALLEARVRLVERRGRLGPHHQIGMRGVGRADDLAAGRAGLRNSGDVGLALLAGQPEFGDVAVPFAGPVPRLSAAHVEIGLNQDGGCRGRGLGRRRKTPPEHRNQQEHRRQSSRYGAREPTGASRYQQAAGEQRIDGNQHKTDAVDAGPGRELIDQALSTCE